MGDLSREDVSNTLQVLVATDCHLGYMEKDEIRRHDCFQAFEDIFTIAEQKKDNLSAVDILSACNLVNYFGKMILEDSGVGQITLYPILIRKSGFNVGSSLYGLGNIRDEHLNIMFQTPHAVQWMQPEAQDECQVAEWFNILVLHQNRVKTNPKNAINEHFLPRFLDFIVWGHEHECLVDPQEVPGMGFHITQPGSSVAPSLIDGESKPKHLSLIEIKGNQYRPTKIPLNSVRHFEYTEIVLKDEPDIDPKDQNSIVEHLYKVVRNLIDKARQKAVNKSEVKLPLVRVKVDYSRFMTINPQRFGQKYVGKVANPEDILIFFKVSKKGHSASKIDDSERLRPEELNQQNIEALVAENNLNKIARVSDMLKFEEEDIILKVRCLEERVKERSHSKDATQFTFDAQSFEDSRTKNKNARGVDTAVSFSYNEDTQICGSKSATRGRRGPSQSFRSSHDASEVNTTSSRGRGRGRRRGRGSTNLKQTTLNAYMGFRHSERSASVAAAASVISIAAGEENVDSASSDEVVQLKINEDDDESLQGNNRKSAASKGRGKSSVTSSKRGRRTDNSSLSHQMFMSRNDDDDDDDVPKKINKPKLG